MLTRRRRRLPTTRSAPHALAKWLATGRVPTDDGRAIVILGPAGPLPRRRECWVFKLLCREAIDEKDEEAVRAIGAASAATQRGVELEAEFAALEAKLRQSLVAKAEDEILARAKATVDTAAARVLETERLVLRRDREPPPAEPAW